MVETRSYPASSENGPTPYLATVAFSFSEVYS